MTGKSYSNFIRKFFFEVFFVEIKTVFWDVNGT